MFELPQLTDLKNSIISNSSSIKQGKNNVRKEVEIDTKDTVPSNIKEHQVSFTQSALF